MLYYARMGDGRVLLIGADTDAEAHEQCRDLAKGVCDWELASLGKDFRGVIIFNPAEDHEGLGSADVGGVKAAR